MEVIETYGGVRVLWRFMERYGRLCKAASQQVAAMGNSQYLEKFFLDTHLRTIIILGYEKISIALSTVC